MGPIAKTSIRTSFVLGLRLLIQASTLLIVARMLGPSEFGVFAGVAALAVLLGAFSTFGTHLVLLGEVSKDRAQYELILRYAIPTTIIVGGILFLIFFTISLLLFDLSKQVIFCIGLTEIILLPLFLLSATEELALEKTARSQLLMIFPLGLRALAAFTIMLITPNEPLILFAWLYLLSALFALLCMKLYKPNAWLNPRKWRFANTYELKGSVGYATLALTTAGPSELDKLLAAKLLPAEVSGVYAASSRVMGAATLPVIALIISAMPRLFRDMNQDYKKSFFLIRWILVVVFIYGLIISSLLWLGAPLLEIIFGQRYLGIKSMFSILCFAIPALTLRYTIGNILITMAKPWLRVKLEIFGMLILLIGAVLFSATLGVNGILLALLMSEWGMAILGLFIICNKCKN